MKPFIKYHREFKKYECRSNKTGFCIFLKYGSTPQLAYDNYMLSVSRRNGDEVTPSNYDEHVRVMANAKIVMG